MNRLIGAMVVATLVCPIAVAQSPPAPAPDAANPVFTQPQDLKWRVYPGGTKAAILHIDPTTRTTELISGIHRTLMCRGIGIQPTKKFR
jgi:hypothetical protein